MNSDHTKMNPSIHRFWFLLDHNRTKSNKRLYVVHRETKQNGWITIERYRTYACTSCTGKPNKGGGAETGSWNMECKKQIYCTVQYQVQ